LERNLEKGAFWMFLEHKSEENDKVLKFLAGTVPDGVKLLHMTASRVTRGGCGTYNVKAQRFFKLIGLTASPWPSGSKY
jgi:hypothetical protein